MNDVLNPVDIENAIRTCADRIHKGVSIVTERERIARSARATYERALARAYLSYDGPAHEKKYAAELAVEEQRDDCDAAEVAYKEAERTAKALVEELRSWQSVGASIRTMYGNQG